MKTTNNAGRVSALLCAVFLAALAPVACAEGTVFHPGLPLENDADDDDGEGGAGGTNAHASASSGSGAASTSSSTSGPGPSSVTSGGPGPGPSSSATGSSSCDGTNNCDTCANCAMNAVCAPEANGCASNLECTNFGDCMSACTPGDDACYNTCATSYPTGEHLYMQFVFCVVCEGCYVDCDGFGAGC